MHIVQEQKKMLCRSIVVGKIRLVSNVWIPNQSHSYQFNILKKVLPYYFKRALFLSFENFSCYEL